MSELLAALASWILASFVLSALLAAGYALLARLRVTAVDRFLFLRLSLVALAVLPLLDLDAARALLPERATHFVEAAVQQPSAPLIKPKSGPGDWVVWALAGSYAAAVGFGLFRIAASHRRLRRILRATAPAGSFRGLPIRTHELDVPPATAGILSPVILMPRALMTELAREDLEIVYLHELTHARRKDSCVHLAALVLAAFLPLAPGARYLVGRLREDMELSCDELVLAGGVSPRAYARLLVALATAFQRPDPAQLVGLFAASAFISRRIRAMRLDTSPTGNSRLCTCALALLLLVAVPPLWAADELATVVTAELIDLPFTEPTPLKDTIKTMAQITGKSIVLSRDASGSVQLTNGARPVSRAAALAAYESAVQQLGLVVEERDGRLHIRKP